MTRQILSTTTWGRLGCCGCLLLIGCAKEVASEKHPVAPAAQVGAAAPAPPSTPVVPAATNPPADTKPAATPAKDEQSATESAPEPKKPKHTLTTRKGEDTVILVINFWDVKDELGQLPADRKRSYLLQGCVDLAIEAGYDKEPGVTNVRLYAFVYNASEYESVGMKAVTQLAVFDIETAKLADASQPIAERMAKIEWKDKSLQR